MSSSLMISAAFLLAIFVGFYFTLRAYRPEWFGISGDKSKEVERCARGNSPSSRELIDRLQEVPEDKDV
ncbi:MAG: hypothetical protein EOP06_03170 [Proteobacteria bacterium]|nr:MAG: hypothetical protein EOP06_03170 [Pseudomonadota bacterium]